MKKIGTIQGVSTDVTTLKCVDGVKRHPARCIFVQDKGRKRWCSNEQCPIWKEHCFTASKCDYYEEKT